MKREGFGGHIAAAMLLTLTACATPPSTFPARADVMAIVTPKPKPSPNILNDPAASDRYSSELEAWGDTISAAGARLCRYFERTGMAGIECPAPPSQAD